MTGTDIAVVARGFQQAAQRTATLFDLEEAAYQLLAVMDDERDIEPEDEEAKAQLALIDQMLMEKTESYVSVIRSLEAMAEARKAEADRLRDRAKSAEQHATWLRSRLLVHMQTTGRQRIETSRFTLSVRQNPVSVSVLNEPVLTKVEAYETMPGVPAEFVRLITLYKVDKRAIAAQVKATGEVVDGTTVSRGESLRIS